MKASSSGSAIASATVVWPFGMPSAARAVWLPLSSRSFISSNGAVSSTICTPGHVGRGPSKSSSTHWLNGSATTVSGSVGVGTMRSTIEHGNATPSGSPRTSRSTSPLRGTLSQEITVSGVVRASMPARQELEDAAALVAALGDRQRDDVRVRIGDPPDHGVGVVGGDERVADHVDGA